MSNKAIQVKPIQAARLMTTCMKSKLVPLLAGSPGIGKSSLVYDIAKKFNLKVIDLRLAQCDPTDLLGFPTIVGKKADYFPMATFPIESDPVPEGYDGWLLFMDELTSALPAIQAAAYKIILDRMVGSHHLHKRVAIIGAGNLETDNAIVQPMSTALQSRMVHLELVVSVEEWIEWAGENDVDHRITDFLQFKPSAIYTFQPDHTDKTYACPRTWEFSNRHLAATEEGSMDRLALLAGTLGEGVAREFNVFLDIYKDLPKIDQIVSKPTEVQVPDEPSVLFALTGTIAHHTTMDNAGPVLEYVSRLPSEFQVVCLKEAKRRNKELVKHPAIQKWVAANAKLFFS